MNIKQLNIDMRTAWHAAGYTGCGIIFALLDTGVVENDRDPPQQQRRQYNLQHS